MQKPKKPKESPKLFTAECPYCGAKFELTLATVQGGSDECDMCGSHSNFTVTCPKCHKYYSDSEV